MKKISFSVLLVFTVVLFYSCSDDVTNNPTTNTAGVFVLYEGTGTDGDYAFISDSNNTVYNDVFSNSNGNANLGPFPDGLLRRIESSNTKLYITAQGNFAGQGRMYRVDARTNQLLDTSALFGQNPYSFASDNISNFYITNIFGNTVTKIDISSLNVTGTINVGPSPSEIVTGRFHMFVCKASYTTENTLAAININNNNVTLIQLQSAPVSAAVINDRVYVSGYLTKTIYIVDSNAVLTDSIPLGPQFTNNVAADIVAGADNNTLYVVGADTTFGSGYYAGKKIYKVDIANKTVANIISLSGNDDIYSIGFDNDLNKQFLYIGNSRGFSENGKVHKYDRNGGLLNVFDIGGKGPRRFAFTY